MSKKNDYPLIREAEVTDIGKGGKAIARKDDLVILVSHAVPGDIIDIQITRKRKRYFEGDPVRFYHYSSLRTEPFCAHFGTCGGCKWQDMEYSAQLRFKEKQITDQLERIAGLPENIHGRMFSILPSSDTRYYRNKLEFTFSAKRWLTREEIASGRPITEPALGFHIAGFFDKILDITECYLQPEPSNKIRMFVKDYALKHDFPFFDIRKQEGLLRNLTIRTAKTGEVMVILSFFYEEKEKINSLMDAVGKQFPGITSLLYVINPKGNDTLEGLDIRTFRGRDYILEELNGLMFKISPKTFFQTNTLQAENLYHTVLDFAEITDKDTVYDLYTGAGTIAIFLAPHAGKVVGIERVEEAIRDAIENSALNSITNTKFLVGDVKNIFSHDLIRQYGKPDVVILDPPRAGIHPDVIKSLLLALPEKIVYVSCNPATQARDIQLLLPVYLPEKIRPVDMFPHTDHVENVVLLIKK